MKTMKKLYDFLGLGLDRIVQVLSAIGETLPWVAHRSQQVLGVVEGLPQTAVREHRDLQVFRLQDLASITRPSLNQF